MENLKNRYEALKELSKNLMRKGDLSGYLNKLIELEEMKTILYGA